MIDNTKRLNFLRKEFNVIDFTDKQFIEDVFVKHKTEGFEPSIIMSDLAVKESSIEDALCFLFIQNIIDKDISGNVIVKTDDNGNVVKKTKTIIYMNSSVFDMIIDSDPTVNKSNSQWMLNLFTNYLKKDDIVNAKRFYDEDLPLANKYLKIFEKNKRKNIFKTHCDGSHILKGVDDCTNINQYKSLSQLYDSVDPFIERDVSEMERKLLDFVKHGQAEIPVKDRLFTVYIPKTKEASSVFNDFAGWCTAQIDRTNFTTYRNQLQPNGNKSNLFIIINNKFFEGQLKSNTLHQIHFESKQIQNRIQSSDVDMYSEVLKHSEGVSNFFYDKLVEMAKDKGDVNDNLYLTYLIKFGWTEALFDLIDEFTPIIKIMNNSVVRIPNLSRFTHVMSFVVSGSGLVDIDPSIGNLQSLELLSLPNNKISSLPKEIGNLKNLQFLNIIGNKGIKIPEEIKYLDKSNGGSLYKIAVRESDIGTYEYLRLKELLPNTKINTEEKNGNS